MKELENHLQVICQIMEEESSNFYSLLRRIKEKSEGLNQIPMEAPHPKKDIGRERGRRP